MKTFSRDLITIGTLIFYYGVFRRCPLKCMTTLKIKALQSSDLFNGYVTVIVLYMYLLYSRRPASRWWILIEIFSSYHGFLRYKAKTIPQKGSLIGIHVLSSKENIRFCLEIWKKAALDMCWLFNPVTPWTPWSKHLLCYPAVNLKIVYVKVYNAIKYFHIYLVLDLR